MAVQKNTVTAPVVDQKSSSSSSPSEVKEEVTTKQDQQETTLPTALQLLHKRLNRRTELLKLHLKHYHMSASQFRRRTSELVLPKEIYDKYDEICRTCGQCSVSRHAPARAKVSGLRADN